MVDQSCRLQAEWGGLAQRLEGNALSLFCESPDVHGARNPNGMHHST